MPLDANLSAQSDGSAWSNATSNGRQKRVMPSRSRRGGPGLGQTDVDILILETQRRKLENEPLIPVDTSFFLTTNPRYAEEASANSDGGIHINVVANDRYFDRPEVLKAFREQAVIQTPEYETMSESMSGVGGRFRPRNLEEAVEEMSDVAYQKRHRKFEIFEKRQRVREREKLKHEHYKLKERIEQLRAMDASFFMSLPTSSFTIPPADVAENVEETTESLFTALNGGTINIEGERRRKEMLDVAIKLEKRYAYLLPSRKVTEISSSNLKDTESRDGEDTDMAPDLIFAFKEKVPKLRITGLKSSTASSSSPVASRSPKKATQEPESQRPASSAIRSSSTFAEPPPAIEDVASSPFIDVVGDVPGFDTDPSQLSPLSLVETDTDTRLSEPPEPNTPTVQNNPQAAEDEVMEALNEPKTPANVEEETALQSQPLENVNVESEKATPGVDVQNLEEVPARRKKRKLGRPKKVVSPPVVPPVELENTQEPVSTSEHEPRRARSRSHSPNDSEEARRGVMWRRSQPVAGPSRLGQFESFSGIRMAAIFGEGGDTLSAPLAKRRRKAGGPFTMEPESISAGVHTPFDPNSLSEISACSSSIRGKPHVSYVDSRTAKRVLTPSLIMVASLRVTGKVRSRRARENTSFGKLTPDFGKGAISDFELPEEILYREKSIAPDWDGHVDVEDVEMRCEDTDIGEDETDELDLFNLQPSEEGPSNKPDAKKRGDSRNTRTPQLKGRRSESHTLLYHGPLNEKLIASPEAEPMIELPPDIRRREPSRHDTEEEVEW